MLIIEIYTGGEARLPNSRLSVLIYFRQISDFYVSVLVSPFKLYSLKFPEKRAAYPHVNFASVARANLDSHTSASIGGSS